MWNGSNIINNIFKLKVVSAEDLSIKLKKQTLNVYSFNWQTARDKNDGYEPKSLNFFSLSKMPFNDFVSSFVESVTMQMIIIK